MIRDFEMASRFGGKWNGALAIVLLSALAYILIFGAYFYKLDRLGHFMPASFSVSGRTFAFSSFAWNQNQEFRGLMNTTVNSSTFMLFNVAGTLLCPASNDTCPFWMYDTPDALDIIWIDVNASGQGHVVYFVNATPYNATQNKLCGYANSGNSFCPIYTPHSYANYVIETDQGFSNRVKLYDGENITLNYG